MSTTLETDDAHTRATRAPRDGPEVLWSRGPIYGMVPAVDLIDRAALESGRGPSASPERTMERTSVPYRTRERNSRNEGRAKQSVARRARRELPVPPYGCSPDDGREIGMRGCGWMIARRLDLIARRAERRSSPSSSPSQCLSVTATQRTRLSGFSTCMIMTSWS